MTPTVSTVSIRGQTSKTRGWGCQQNQFCLSKREKSLLIILRGISLKIIIFKELLQFLSFDIAIYLNLKIILNKINTKFNWAS